MPESDANDLIAFVTARIAEDEQTARQAGGGDRHCPARVLREVEAKRRILAEHAPERQPAGYDENLNAEGYVDVCGRCAAVGGRVDHPCPTVRLLAAAWSDHPDFREEWGA